MRNRVQLIGNLGRDIELKTAASGKTYAKFTLATNDRYKGADGEQVVNTQWHNLTAFGVTAKNMAKLLAKGSEVVVEGKLTYNQYEDKNGTTRYITDIIVGDFKTLSKSHAPLPV